ncbi:MAG: hypothetical protein HUU50_04725 [Candidatus Brocadiae bacterium]|nr:hypothetical protein [Candidatus Brocadiia bacterium]
MTLKTFAICFLLLALCVSGGHAALLSFEDFEAGASGWNDNTTDNSNSTFTRFLGRFAGTGSAQGYYKSYALNGLPNIVTVQFDFYRIDSWDAENFLVFIDNAMVSTMTYVGNGTPTLPSYIQALTPVQEMGWSANAGWQEQKLRYTFLVNTQASSIKLGFGSSLNSGIADESWGIDNVTISYQQVPEISVLYLFSISLLLIVFFSRKRLF